MKTLWMEIRDVRGDHGQRFLVGGSGVSRLCLFCDAAFPQTDEGWQALKDHGFEEHEAIQHYDWLELDGQEVTIVVITRRDDSDPWLYPGGREQTELAARTKDGAIYFLPFSYYDRGDKGGFKWKPKPGNSSLRLMPGAQASQSNG